MLITQTILTFLMTHPYDEHNEAILEADYFDIWGKNKDVAYLVEMWKRGVFKGMHHYIMPLRFIEDQIEPEEWDVWEADCDVCELLDRWERKNK